MKKIFSFIIAFVMMITLANAQTVEHSRLFENTYVTLSGGAITTTHMGGQPFFWDGAKNIVNGVRPLAGLEFGKYVTPVVGFSVEGLAMFNTTGSNTWVDQSNVVGNLKFNLSNWFGGYKGQPRKVEVVFVPGLGWGHDYGDVYHDRNYLTYNVGAELNVNLGKERAWQVNVKPVVMWNNYNNALYPTLGNMQARVQFGLTYKFGSKRKGGAHNFVLCPYSVTKEDYDALQAKYDELAARKPEVKEVVKTQIDTVVVEKPVVNNKFSTIISFELGSSELVKRELAKLGVFSRVLESNEKVNIIGSADTSTGSLEINENLSAKRAEVVKNALIELGVSADRITTSTALDTNAEPSASRAAVLTVTE